MDETASSRVVERFTTEVLGGQQTLRVSTDVVVVQDDLVAVHLTGGGTHRGAFQGCPATGRTWENDLHSGLPRGRRRDRPGMGQLGPAHRHGAARMHRARRERERMKGESG